MEEVKNHLANLVPFAINYFRQIKKKYGKGQGKKNRDPQL
jgi:topoisomerase IV subunit A